MPKRNPIILCVAALCLLAVVALFAWQIRQTEFPRSLFLCALQGAKQEVSFVCPKGDHFNLVVGLPKEPPNSTGHVAGTLSVTCGTRKVDLSFDTRGQTRANWLQMSNLDGYIVTWPLGKPAFPLDRQLGTSNQAVIQIELKVSDVPGPASLWLTYLAKGRENSPK